MSGAAPATWPTIADIHTLVFDFDGVFTDNKVIVDQHGTESVRCDRGDGLGFDLLRAYCARNALNLDMFILSKEPNPVVLARANKLKLKCQHGIDNKLVWMNDYLSRRSSTTDAWQGVAYLGNDLNDLPIMLQAGLAVAPADAHPRILACATTVLPQAGGNGFIRAFIEHLIGLENASDEEIHELICHC